MTTERKPVDPARVIELNTRELTENYRRTVTEALPARHRAVPDEFWRELADGVAAYFAAHRKSNTPERRGSIGCKRLSR